MRRILDEAAFLARHLDPEKPDAAVKCMLAILGVDPHIGGYACLTAAIRAFHASPSRSFTKELYTDVGLCQDPPIGDELVERLLRYALGKAWANRDSEVWDCYFPHGKKPTSGEFIARIAEVLHILQSCSRRTEEPPQEHDAEEECALV